MQYKKNGLKKKELTELYTGMLKPRMIEEKMLNLLRQGRVSKWFSGIGQEAIAVGVTKALDKDEYIFPLHRNLGVFTCRDMALDKLFLQLQGKKGGFSKGRERSFHFGSMAHHIVGMISHLGPQLTLANGVALANLFKKNKKIAVAFSGEGGTSEGDFHEALNVAAVWNLPVIFVIENNGYGLSTPTNEQFKCKQIADRGKGYGMEAKTIDGNNILEVYNTVSSIKKSMQKKPRPFLLECMTFRMRGHEEASGTKYVPKKLFDIWGKKDPLNNYENYLLRLKIISKKDIEKLRAGFKAEIEKGLEIAFAESLPVPDTNEEFNDVYAPIKSKASLVPGNKTTKKRLVDAISDGLKLSMKKHKNLIIMGQDVGDYGGVFKITEGFVKEFGKERVRNTPLCESAIVGAALGLSMNGYKSVMEMQFADFVTCGFNQIINNLAKLHYRWGEKADVVIRMPTGAGVGAGPFHSQSNEAWFAHTPGLKVVYPSNPADAKGLLIAAINDPNPVMFFEHKALYRSLEGEVPDNYYETEIGKAALVKEGSDLSIITYGAGVHWALEALNENKEISANVLDLRTLLPLDYEAIQTTVKKTGKAIILHEDTFTGGIGGEIAAHISQHCFEYLDAPVMRCASLDTPVPFSTTLEQNFLPKERFKGMLVELNGY